MLVLLSRSIAASSRRIFADFDHLIGGAMRGAVLSSERVGDGMGIDLYTFLLLLLALSLRIKVSLTHGGGRAAERVRDSDHALEEREVFSKPRCC